MINPSPFAFYENSTNDCALDIFRFHGFSSGSDLKFSFPVNKFENFSFWFWLIDVAWIDRANVSQFKEAQNCQVLEKKSLQEGKVEFILDTMYYFQLFFIFSSHMAIGVFFRFFSFF